MGLNVAAPMCGEYQIELFSEGDEVEKASPKDQRALRWCVWALLKNSFRKQVLREVLKKHPVTMYCDTKQLNHASEIEIGSVLPDVISNLTVVNTSDWSVEMLRQIPKFGDIQLQATDPQSVHSGIPYRVFQSAASGRCLLTDGKPGLNAAFSKDLEYYGYDNAKDVCESIYMMRAFSGTTKLIGEAAHQRFLKEHTWEHRLIEFETLIKSRTKIPEPEWANK
jgi:hypothetical protein